MPTPVYNFCVELENKLDKDKVSLIKNAPIDSVVYIINQFKSDYRKIYHDSIQLKALKTYFKKIDFKVNPIAVREYQDYYLRFAFHGMLNNKKFNSDTLIKECRAEFDRMEKNQQLEDLRNEARSCKIMYSNVKKCLVGDVFNIILPVYQTCAYSTNQPYPLSLDYSSIAFDDSLKIKCLFVQKKYEMDSCGSDKINVIFKLKILKLSNPKYSIDWKKCKKGDTFNFLIEYYGRPIENIKHAPLSKVLKVDD
jgi:hypothetical protein